MKYVLIVISLVVIGIIGFVVIRSDDGTTINSNQVVDNISDSIVYQNIDPAELASKLSVPEDLFLLDVHIPEQEHIDKTDAFIPYNSIESNLGKLPQDKNMPIVVYCRSGSMSKIASEKLINLGYTDVSNLNGGIYAWNSFIN